MKRMIKAIVPPIGLKLIYRLALKKPYSPAIGRVRSGDFLREMPFCTRFGYKRGGPLDRYYIERFLERERTAIAGRVLEIGDNEYTEAYGDGKVERSDILHVDDSNPKATYVGDLSDAPHLPENVFDCIILTQTLHLIYDISGALETCHRILKPGGSLLLTVPGITPVDRSEWRETWYWSFTERSLKRALDEAFSPDGRIAVETHGNVYVAAAFLYGMGRPEVPERMMGVSDPSYPVIVTGKAVKGGLAE